MPGIATPISRKKIRPFNRKKLKPNWRREIAASKTIPPTDNWPRSRNKISDFWPTRPPQNAEAPRLAQGLPSPHFRRPTLLLLRTLLELRRDPVLQADHEGGREQRVHVCLGRHRRQEDRVIPGGNRILQPIVAIVAIPHEE